MTSLLFFAAGRFGKRAPSRFGKRPLTELDAEADEDADEDALLALNELLNESYHL